MKIKEIQPGEDGRVRRVLLQYENIQDSTVDLSRVKYHETGGIIHNIVEIVPAQEKIKKSSTAV